MNVMYKIRYIVYLVVFASYSLCSAGSYDDYFVAIKRDQADVIGALIERGFDANTPNAQGEQGLFLAIRESSLKVASRLLDWPGTDVEARTPQDESPLMLAALKGFTELCRRLIARGADVNKPGWAPLHYAATNGHVEVMALLLDENAYIDAASPNGTTPLMMAAHYGTPAAVNLLLASGADPMLKNDQGLTALDFALSAGRTEMVELLAASIRQRQPKGTW